jgi:6-pyruvoyltetrahydropterin/6-carboxytetrahydropterin synthase
MQISTRLEFDAGHRIPSHKSQCRNLQGHRYALEITLSGDIIQQENISKNGMVMDFFRCQSHC